MHIEQGYKIYFEKDWGLFIGAFSDNLPHQHYAIQLSITTDKPLSVTTDNQQTYTLENCVLASNSMHQFSCESVHLSLFFYPTSSIGHFFATFLHTSVIKNFDTVYTQKLQLAAKKYQCHETSFEEFIAEVTKIIHNLHCNCTQHNHFGDERIEKAMAFLEEHHERVVSLEEISDIICLSPSRFLHLFKEKTGISYRRMQLWNKISHSFRYLATQSITATAHQAGFTDSAHYCKTFKETFGFSPKQLAKQ